MLRNIKIKDDRLNDSIGLIIVLKEIMRQPRHSPITLTKIEDRLVVDIPPVWLRSQHSRLLGLLSLIGTGASLLSLLGLISFLYAHNSDPNIDYIDHFIDKNWSIKYIIYWPVYVIIALYCLLKSTYINEEIINFFVFVIFGIIIIGIWGLFLLYLPISLLVMEDFAIAAGSRMIIEIDKDKFRLQQSFLGSLKKEFHRPIQEIDRIELQGIKQLKNTKHYTVCAIISKLSPRGRSARLKTHADSFGFFLTQAEKEWLVGEINAFLEKN